MRSIHFSTQNILGRLKLEGGIKAFGFAGQTCHRRVVFYDELRRGNLNSKEEEEK